MPNLALIAERLPGEWVADDEMFARVARIIRQPPHDPELTQAAMRMLFEGGYIEWRRDEGLREWRRRPAPPAADPQAPKPGSGPTFHPYPPMPSPPIIPAPRPFNGGPA